MTKAAVLKKDDIKKNISKPVKSVAAPKPQLKVVKLVETPRKAVNAPAAEVKKPVAKKAENTRKEFKVGDHVVYPTHGVGRITAQETQEIAGIQLRMLVISFEKDKMTLRVPTHRATAAGLRHISGGAEMDKVFTTLKSKARISRGMWSRRAQEYEGKINSGNIISIAEVVRDLHQNVDQAERSYSERMIYESALNRLVGELAAAEKTDYKLANDKLITLLRAKVAA